jgi:hypothetical protein
VFLVDDSREDTEGWSDIRQTLKRLAEITILYDKNGIDLHFVSGQADLRSVLRSQNMEVILDAFDRNTPPPSDLISLFHKVDKLLSNYVQRFERARDKAERCGLEHDFTNLNLIILTDGRSLLNNMGFKELKRIIYEWAQKLDNLYAPVGQVGMQFVLIGGSEEAWKKVKELDNKLHLHGKRTTR